MTMDTYLKHFCELFTGLDFPTGSDNRSYTLCERKRGGKKYKVLSQTDQADSIICETYRLNIAKLFCKS